MFPDYGDNLDATLDVIINFQDRVGPDNFQDLFRELVAVCPVYFQLTEDDEPRLLTPE